MARFRVAAADAAGGAAVAGVEVEVGGHLDAYQVVSFQGALVVREAGDFAGGLDFAVGGSGGDIVDVEAEAALGAADGFRAAGDDGDDGVFEGRHAFPHPADGLDGGGQGAMADGGAGVAAMRAADGMGGTASVARTAGARGVGGTASATRAGGVGITVGAGRAGGFVGGGRGG